MPKTGRPPKEFNRKLFLDLIGIGCEAEEICWVFRDENEKPANIDTLSRWCKRTFGMTFQEFRVKNGKINLKIQLRKNQLKLSETSASMAIYLGKVYLGQNDKPEDVAASDDGGAVDPLTAAITAEIERRTKGGGDEGTE